MKIKMIHVDLSSYSVAEIEKYLKEKRHTAFVLWQVEDIAHKSRELNEDGECRELNTKECEEVIEILNARGNCETGITWTEIENEIINYCNHKFLKNENTY